MSPAPPTSRDPDDDPGPPEPGPDELGDPVAAPPPSVRLPPRPAPAAAPRTPAEAGDADDERAAERVRTPASGTADPPAPDRPARRRALVGVGAVAVVGLIAVAVLGWLRASDLESDEEARQEVAEVSGAFASALLSYDHTDLAAAREAVAATATDTFVETYDIAFGEEALGSVIVELQAVSEATVRDVFVGSVGGDTARAIVVADARTVGLEFERSVDDVYLELALERVDGEWRVGEAVQRGALEETVGGGQVPLPTDPGAGGGETGPVTTQGESLPTTTSPTTTPASATPTTAAASP